MNTRPRTESNALTPSGPKVVFAIPARLGSTRLPGKPLRKIGERTIVELVVERSLQCAQELRQRSRVASVSVLVATDSPEIAAVVEHAGVASCLTSPDLPSGTDRIAAALCAKEREISLHDNDLVVNIQGDEPFFSIVDVVALVEKMLERPEVPMGTLAFRRHSSEMFLSSSVVKVVIDKNGFASYFSRAPVPWPRAWLGASGHDWVAKAHSPSGDNAFWHHIGVYAFRYLNLKEFTTVLPASELEKTEGLEQLRALENGWKLLVEPAAEAPQGIDTEADLANAQLFAARGSRS